MYFLYSLSVVAPIQWSSPLAKAGLSMLEASTDPSAAPAPTTVCNSSINKIIWSWRDLISLSRALIRSSNSPRNLVPATNEPISRASSFLPLRFPGTSSVIIRWASPSTIAVFPTPGSPIRTGLFLVRRQRTWMILLISSSRPITGSSLFCEARLVRSRVNFSRT